MQSLIYVSVIDNDLKRRHNITESQIYADQLQDLVSFNRDSKLWDISTTLLDQIYRTEQLGDSSYSNIGQIGKKDTM